MTRRTLPDSVTMELLAIEIRAGHRAIPGQREGLGHGTSRAGSGSANKVPPLENEITVAEPIKKRRAPPAMLMRAVRRPARPRDSRTAKQPYARWNATAATPSRYPK